MHPEVYERLCFCAQESLAAIEKWKDADHIDDIEPEMRRLADALFFLKKAQRSAENQGAGQ